MNEAVTFTGLIDLAAQSFGGTAIGTSDDFFAGMENLLLPGRGVFVPERTVLLDNKVRHHRAGYEVVTPLRLNGVHVLVNRGWVEAGRTRADLPQVPVPGGEVRVEGVALARLPHHAREWPPRGCAPGRRGESGCGR